MNENHEHEDETEPTSEEWRESGPIETPEELIRALDEEGVLTRRQARVYVHREILGEPRESVADHLGIEPSTLDSHLSRARERIERARSTVEGLRSYGGTEFLRAHDLDPRERRAVVTHSLAEKVAREVGREDLREVIEDVLSKRLDVMTHGAILRDQGGTVTLDPYAVEYEVGGGELRAVESGESFRLGTVEFS